MGKWQGINGRLPHFTKTLKEACRGTRWRVATAGVGLNVTWPCDTPRRHAAHHGPRLEGGRGFRRVGCVSSPQDNRTQSKSIRAGLATSVRLGGEDRCGTRRWNRAGVRRGRTACQRFKTWESPWLRLQSSQLGLDGADDKMSTGRLFNADQTGWRWSSSRLGGLREETEYP